MFLGTRDGDRGDGHGDTGDNWEVRPSLRGQAGDDLPWLPGYEEPRSLTFIVMDYSDGSADRR